jgi:hypothetical protein
VNDPPKPLRILNKLMHLLPPDFTLRDVSVNGLWYASGQFKIAQYLWEMLRWECRERGTILTAAFDSRDPAMNVVTLKPWNQPRPKITVAIHAPTPINRDQLDVCQRTGVTSHGLTLPSGSYGLSLPILKAVQKLADFSWAIESIRERHHSLLRSAMDAYNGYVFQIIGDAFCVAFHTASDGARAALEAQQKLQAEDWGDTPIKVRMGLHTGSAELHGQDYRGYLTMAKSSA